MYSGPRFGLTMLVFYFSSSQVRNRLNDEGFCLTQRTGEGKRSQLVSHFLIQKQIIAIFLQCLLLQPLNDKAPAGHPLT